MSGKEQAEREPDSTSEEKAGKEMKEQPNTMKNQTKAVLDTEADLERTSQKQTSIISE